MNDAIYQDTRQFALSLNNPFFFTGNAAEGIGGSHAGMDMIWPLSIILRGLTATNDAEIKQCLDTLQHTRKWFVWANTLFGEFVWKVYRERKHLLS